MKLKRIAIAMAVVAIVISVVPSVIHACICKYTPGYWKRCVTAYVEEKGDYPADRYEVKESDSSMEAYEDWIRANIEPDFTLEWAYEELWMRGPGRQPIRENIADMFNWAKAAVNG